MAFKRYTIDGYGQLELNNVAFRRDGRIEAQCGLSKDDFAPANAAKVPAENGMVLVVDKVKREVRFVDANETLPVALHYSSEHMYDERKHALKDFKIEYKENDYFLPRMGYLNLGDLFTTNCIGYDSAKWADDEAFEEACEACKTTRLYAVPSAVGAWQIVDAKASAGCCAEVVKAFSMPDGQFALQLRVIAL